MNDDTIGGQITRWRKVRGLSQSELQRRARLSSPSIVSRAEKGTLPTPENMRSIARALGAEFSLMEAYDRATSEKSRGGPSEFHIASTQCLLAAPLALLELEDVVMSTTRAADPGDAVADDGAGFDASYVPLTDEVIERLLDDGTANAVLRYRRRSAAGTHRVVATLHCEYSSDGVDLVSGGDTPETVRVAALTSVLGTDKGAQESRRSPLETAGDEAKMLADSRQLPPDLFRTGPEPRSARARQRGPLVSMEPFTSRRLRGRPASPQTGGAARTLTTQLDLVVASEYDFRASQQLLAAVLERLRGSAEELSVRRDTADRAAVSPATLRQVARVFDTSLDVVQGFLARAEPCWQLALAPIWLPRPRGVH